MKDAAVLVVAVLAGFFLLSYDQRTDDAGVEAGLLVAISLALAFALVGAGIGWMMRRGSHFGTKEDGVKPDLLAAR